ncbi:benzoate 4-monooxygenase cytochrome P450 [Penicillium canescens]|nr:benzoate 4-monooxygenase cytochrome P450 [Penicillium canescens]
MAILIVVLVLLVFCIARPLASYLYDAKNFWKYPNLNFLSGFTSLSYVWEHRRSFRTRRLYDLHQKHPIIRLGPNALSFADVRAIKDIYGHGTPCLKDDVYALTAGSHSHLLNVVDREDHARKRRMLSNAFATRNLEQWEFKITDKVERLLKQLDQRCTSPLSPDMLVNPDDLTVKFRFWSNLFTVDAIADIALSKRLGLLDLGSDDVAVDGFNGYSQSIKYLESLHRGNRVSSRIIGAKEWFQFLRVLSTTLSPYLRSQWEHGRKFGRIVSALAGQRLQLQEKGNTPSDFLACLIEDKKGNARSLDRGEIDAEASIFLDAGSDTTAIALTDAMYYLIKSPQSLKKLREEVAGALFEKDVAPYSKVKNLPYLKACLDESLRLGLERKTPPEGMQILGESIPGNVTVSVPTYVAHRDPDIFPAPEVFRPERRLEDEEKVKQMRAVFIPFSTGARACIGRNITFIEQQILVATLVPRYDFALPSEDWKLDWEEAFNLWPAQMPLKIWRRDEKVALKIAL